MKSNKKDTKKTIAYVRSSDNEKVNTHYLNEQEKEIRKFASENNCKVIKVFREVNKSAKTLERPQLQAMIECIKSNKLKIECLIVTDIAKLSRDCDGLHAMKRFLRLNKVKLISMLDSALKGIGKQLKEVF